MFAHNNQYLYFLRYDKNIHDCMKNIDNNRVFVVL